MKSRLKCVDSAALAMSRPGRETTAARVPCYRSGSFRTGTAMTDVAERRKRGQEKAGGWGETIRTVVYAVADRTGRADLRLRAVQHSVGLDDPDPAGRRLPVRLEVLLRLQQALVPVLDGHRSPGRIFGRTPERGDVAVFKFPATRARAEPHRLHQAHRRPAGRSHPGDQRRAAHQRQAGRAHAHRRLRAGRQRPLPEGHALQGDAAQRPQHTRSRVQRQRLGRQHAGVPGAGRQLLRHGRQPRQFARQPHAADAARLRGSTRDRDQLGWYVPAENLVGRAEFIFFSHDPSAAGWLEPWKWPQAIRFSRFFMAIH